MRFQPRPSIGNPLLLCLGVRLGRPAKHVALGPHAHEDRPNTDLVSSSHVRKKSQRELGERQGLDIGSRDHGSRLYLRPDNSSTTNARICRGARQTVVALQAKRPWGFYSRDMTDTAARARRITVVLFDQFELLDVFHVPLPG